MERIEKLNNLIDMLIAKNQQLEQEKEVLQRKISILLNKNDELDQKNKDMIVEINKILSASLNNGNQ